MAVLRQQSNLVMQVIRLRCPESRARPGQVFSPPHSQRCWCRAPALEKNVSFNIIRRIVEQHLVASNHRIRSLLSKITSLPMRWDMGYLELPAAEFSAAMHCGRNSRRIPENQPRRKKSAATKQKRRNTVCFPGISAAAFPPISANRGVEKTETKFCRKSGRNAANPKRCHF